MNDNIYLNQLKARRRINDAQKSGQTWLDLGDLGLKVLPPELGQLSELRSLGLGRRCLRLQDDNRVEWVLAYDRPAPALEDLTPLVNLTQLTALDLSGCDLVTDLGPLRELKALTTLNIASCKSVTDVGPLRELRALISLDLSFCDLVTDLAPLRELKALTTLHIPSCKLVADLGPLRELKALTTLDLFECQSVSDLAPLRELTALTILRLTGCNSVTDLGPLRELTALSILDLSCCELVTDLGPLRELKALSILDLSGCDLVTDLGPLRELTALTTLNTIHCDSVADLKPLCELKALTALRLGECDLVTDLGPLRKLKALTTLDLSGCDLVTDLEPLRELTALTTLEMYECDLVTDLEPLQSLPNLQELSVGSKGLSLPDHLRGSSDARAILTWFREDRSKFEKRPLAEVKVLLVGQGRVGKTHLCRRLFDNNNVSYYQSDEKSTPHIDCIQNDMMLPNESIPGLTDVKLRVWDFGGQNELHSSHRFFLGSERCFYILVIAADRPANGESRDSNRLNYWLRLIAYHGRRNDGQKAPVLIAITRCDRPEADSHCEQLAEALRLARTNSNPWFGANVVGEPIWGLGWSDSLSKTFNGSIWERHEDAAQRINSTILTHLSEVVDLAKPISAIYHDAKKFIEMTFATDGIARGREGRPYLAVDDEQFATVLANRPGHETDLQRQDLRSDCLGRLHNLGVVHWVGDRREIHRAKSRGIESIVFNPDWVRPPIYQLLRPDSLEPAHAWFMSDYRIRELLPARTSATKDGANLFERLAFREEDRGRILELMKACHLVFDHPEGIVVPDQLKSADLFDDNTPDGSWKYTVDFLPEKVFLRFIAEQFDSVEQRADRFFRNQLDWNTTGGEVRLEAHYSPPGTAQPFILVRFSGPKQPDALNVVERVKTLFDEIFRKEGFRDVVSELIRIGQPETTSSPPTVVTRISEDISVMPTAEKMQPQLRTFCQIIEWCRRKGETVFSGREVADLLKTTEGTVRNHLNRVVDFFAKYVEKYGCSIRREPGFKLKTARARDAYDTDRIVAVASGAGCRICEPLCEWAWNLTHAYLKAVNQLPAPLNDKSN